MRRIGGCGRKNASGRDAHAESGVGVPDFWHPTVRMSLLKVLRSAKPAKPANPFNCMPITTTMPRNFTPQPRFYITTNTKITIIMALNTKISMRALVVTLKSPIVSFSLADIFVKTGISISSVNRIYAKAIKRGFNSNVRPLVIKDK